MIKNIIIFGNSITQGAFDNECGGWVNRLSAHCFDIAVQSDYEDRPIVFNLGISGENIHGIHARYGKEIEARTDEEERAVVLLAVGINDSKINIATGEHKTNIEEYKKLLQEVIRGVKEFGCDVVCVGLTPVDDTLLDPIPWNTEFAYRNSEVERFNACIETLAAEEGVPFVPMFDVFGTDYRKYLGDGLHPTAEGHRRMFERVRDFLKAEGFTDHG